MALYERILVPTDGSEATTATLAHALSIAADHDAEVHALSVIDTRITRSAPDEGREGVERALETEAESAVGSVRDEATAAGLEATTEVRRGRPDREILAVAEEIGADLIVIGAHGKTPREKLATMGSVSERVVDGADRPVLVVRGE
ncbi:universal stress protein [Natronorarus salvus]|uniref:universal stress protein n=1 Tax=Natronorarus salvus TaxID=3117733 RepID=UPI002F261F68